MPIRIPSDTRKVLGANADECKSRSLFLDRFANPAAKEQERKAWFDSLITKSAVHVERPMIVGTDGVLLHAQLQSRLMVNMAGGVMENAGICIDRFGLPYIPGSAVKGCARRLALAALREWCETDVKPGTEENGDENLFKDACAPFEKQAEMFAAIALVFGWTEQDWKNGSDFAWAYNVGQASCLSERAEGSQTSHNVGQASCLSQGQAGRSPYFEQAFRLLRQAGSSPYNFAGTVSFLPAYPVDLPAGTETRGMAVPRTGKLELDVVTCHHPKYYRNDPSMPVALDVEDPNPVIFPAVAPGHVFAFPLLPLRHSRASVPLANGGGAKPLDLARTWLASGLNVFGLGAKTNAGYGWFDASAELQAEVVNSLKAVAARREEAERRRAEEERSQAEAEERRRKREEEKAATANLTPEQVEDFKLTRMNPDQLQQHIQKFEQRTPAEQAAIYRLLTGERIDLWLEIRHKSESGKAKEKKRFTPVVQELFKMAKERKEKMPK